MKNKREKSSKFGGKIKKVVSDVSPSTSIPPLVEGHVRCFLRVTLSRVLWTVAKPPPRTLMRLRWWGETTSGTVFCPRDGSLDREKDVKSTARFPVRCGPKQFTSYLTDMGSLVLDVLTKPDHLPIARVQIPGIAKLSFSRSVNGSFTLVSPVSEKLGELQATLVLEPLTETYDSSNSVPTVDLNKDTAVSAPRLISDQNMLLPSSSQFGSKTNGNESDPGGSSRGTPIGKDHLYFQERGIPHSARPNADAGASVNRNLQEKSGEPNSLIPSTSVDLLSVLLERGSKLRNAMVVSALQSDIDSEMGLKDASLHLQTDNTGALPPSILSTTPVKQNILHSSIHHSTQDPELLMPDTHDTALEQLLGSVNGSVLALWDGEGSLPGSLSGCSSLLLDSELSDPQYDQSLLENLFYKASVTDSCLDAEDEHEQQNSLEKNARLDLGVISHSGNMISFHGLSLDRVSLLGGISSARVIVIQLSVPIDNTSNISRKQSGKGRPPLPLTTRKCTYFVEYHFPLASANNATGKSIPVEVIRAVSNKAVGGVVKFQHRSVFPVHFSGATIKQWWDTNLNFTIYLRKIHQKKPVPIGTAVFQLRTLLQSDRLSITTSLPVQRIDSDYTNQDIGPLKVSFELAENKKDFTSKSRSGNMAACAGTSPLKADISLGQPDDGDAIDFPHVSNSSQKTDRRETPPMAVHSSSNIVMPEARSVSPQGAQNFPRKPAQLTEEEDSDLLFHTLLMVPDGKDFHCAPLQPNVYLNCKLFGSEETIRSVVSWGQTHPTFSLIQVAPVALTSKLLERMRNNMMIIEVWLRASSAHDDKLLGLVKLPLHQFYMSFRDPKVCQLLLQAQYPVVAVDSYMPVVDIFSGGTRGSLRVFLAMGTSQQITALQRMRDEDLSAVSRLPRPVHLLDHRPIEDVKLNTPPSAQAKHEHVFLLRIERVKGLIPLQSTIWGEADCYIQYSFPIQEEAWQDNDPHIVESNVDLKSYRTATTLCMPDPVFGHRETHVLVAPPGVPVQKLLLSSLASQGFSNGGGIQFEVWCRYYYPNVREQLVARGLLPMAKLCAMVTMQRQGEMEAQLFCLPLVPKSDKPTDVQTQPSGLLEVSVQYKTRPVRRNSLKEGILPTRVVNLVVQVHRATGLQAAARAIGLKYYSEVGVNSFVTLQLSFLPEKEIRTTRITARSFCPQFEHHTEFCCQLLVQRDSGESVSLAEVLQEAMAIFTVYNRDGRKVMNASGSEDSILGSVKIRLAELLDKRTGISGWYALSLPSCVSLHHGLTSVGGLELSINFSHRTDRERVLSSARMLGWEPATDGREEDWDDEKKWDTPSQRMCTMTFSILMPRAWLPVHSLLLPGHTKLQRSTYCYYRYKFNDQEAFCSELRHPALEDGEDCEGMATVAFTGTQVIELRISQPLLWYLREEKLEVQLWVSFGKEKRIRPHKLDRLVGSAFVDLSTLTKTSEHKQTISGVYPLFNPSAADLGGAALRAHITVTAGSVPHTHQAPTLTEEEIQLSSPGEEEEDKGPSPIQSPTPNTQSRQHCGSNIQQTKSVQSSNVITSDNTFTATVSIERAMHLSLKGCPKAERNNSLPSCWVSYVTADEPATVSTSAVQDSECPVWDHQQDCRLSKELLLDPQQSLVFKVWHRGEIERVIGFTSVDLSPLLSGFQSVCGWYNITDLSGQCQGQIKVSVSPRKGVQELRAQRQTMHENTATEYSPLFSAMPLCYQTTAVYSSFPSHISRFSEQRISTPEQADRLLFTRLSQADHHDEHMDKVRQFHKNLREKESVMLSNCAGDPSSSALFSALRKNLSELDDIRKYFSRKLSTPVFSALGELNQNPVDKEPHRDSETDTQQLLLKSNQLVGEVNEIIKNISEHQTKKASSNTHSSPTTSPAESDVCVFSSVGHSENCGTENVYNKAPETEIEDISPLLSLTSEEPDPRNEELNQDSLLSEDVNKEEDEVEEDDNDEFEETLIEPRPLNEITSATDRTSPWTTVLSDPELGSLESLEATEQPADIIYQKGREMSPPVTTSKLQRTSSDSDLSVEIESCEDTGEDTVRDTGEDTGEDTVRDTEGCDARDVHVCGEDGKVHNNNSKQDTGQRRDHDQQDSASDTEDSGSPLSSSSGSRTKAYGKREKTESNEKLCDAVEIPNFFLPSHHLEASMRALRLAPVFPLTAGDPTSGKPEFTYHRVTRPRPSIPPSSAKREETKRIAKIFASHFTQ
ncbi:C2 domain-containing protein 3 isoform X1 [Tachysurus vachellii]|uniref:C2 domain-containing protein 3 isoform X1 n=1 Tax=Tachysurus vachellii TaxID=175792 RepID=UPI00296B1FB6|nr:C2 domain-containing protein 3 isoform X1 [Tachysurus vachellii]